MSTTSFDYGQVTQGRPPRTSAAPLHAATHQTRTAPVARRPSRDQGLAIETIGHAIEYLVDMQMLETEPDEYLGHTHAVQLLSQLSRQVFEECPAYVPLSQKVASWVAVSLSSGDLETWPG